MRMATATPVTSKCCSDCLLPPVCTSLQSSSQLICYTGTAMHERAPLWPCPHEQMCSLSVRRTPTIITMLQAVNVLSSSVLLLPAATRTQTHLGGRGRMMHPHAFSPACAPASLLSSRVATKLPAHVTTITTNSIEVEPLLRRRLIAGTQTHLGSKLYDCPNAWSQVCVFVPKEDAVCVTGLEQSLHPRDCQHVVQHQQQTCVQSPLTACLFVCTQTHLGGGVV